MASYGWEVIERLVKANKYIVAGYFCFAVFTPVYCLFLF